MPLAKFLTKLTTHRPMRLIEVNDKPYLERYHMLSILGREIWLHHFLTGDGDRHVHDHPWSALSIILTGGYTEISQVGSKNLISIYRAIDTNWIPAAKKHRIESVIPGTWTLMLVGKRHGKGWFFYHPNGWTTKGQSSGRKWYLTAKRREVVYSDLQKEKV